MYLAGHVPAKKQISHSHSGTVGKPHSGPIPSTSAVRKHGSDARPMAHEAGGNQVLNQGPLAACLEAGLRVTTGAQSCFEGMAIGMALSNGTVGSHTHQPKPLMYHSAATFRALPSAFDLYSKPLFQELGSLTPHMDPPCSCLPSPLPPAITPEQTSGAHYLPGLQPLCKGTHAPPTLRTGPKPDSLFTTHHHHHSCLTHTTRNKTMMGEGRQGKKSS